MQAEPWAPRDALLDDALVTRIAALTRDWAITWFGPDKRIEARAALGASFPGAARDARTWRRSGLILSLDPRAPLGWWMLGLQTGAQALKAADETLLNELAAHAAEDFMRRTGALFGGGVVERNHSERHGRDDIVWSISVGAATNILHLIAPSSLASKARLGLLPRFPPDNAPRSRREAIVRQPIRVGAMLGVGCMALSEMCTLAAGDIVVLDHGPNDAVALSINGHAQRDTRCEIHQQGTHLSLRLGAPDEQDWGQGR